jgi:hypothetical protein
MIEGSLVKSRTMPWHRRSQVRAARMWPGRGANLAIQLARMWGLDIGRAGVLPGTRRIRGTGPVPSAGIPVLTCDYNVVLLLQRKEVPPCPSQRRSVNFLGSSELPSA